MGAFKIAKTVIGSMFKKPATLMYPVVAREWQERTRGSIDIDINNCILCGICGKKCPTGAINVDRKESTWEIQRMQCIQCGACVEACPKTCLFMNNKYTEPGTEKVINYFEIPVAKKDNGAAKKDGAAAAAKDADGDLACNRDECIYCGLCAKACPCDALKIDRKEKVWEVDKEACVKCGACIDKCPKKCLGFGEPPAAKSKAEPKKDAKPAGKDKAEKAEEKPAEKNLPKLDAEKCIYCRACENECPEEAISAEVDEWTLDEDKCIGCGACTDVCPADALKM